MTLLHIKLALEIIGFVALVLIIRRNRRAG